mmetsp:Transcript_12989/g.42529  ORF Transcript_12989/g.42529 Transcript_12989/m.42529 type:complete len:348 (-) Transcript_12989:746-1789(-)
MLATRSYRNPSALETTWLERRPAPQATSGPRSGMASAGSLRPSGGTMGASVETRASPSAVRRSRRAFRAISTPSSGGGASGGGWAMALKSHRPEFFRPFFGLKSWRLDWDGATAGELAADASPAFGARRWGESTPNSGAGPGAAAFGSSDATTGTKSTPLLKPPTLNGLGLGRPAPAVSSAGASAGCLAGGPAGCLAPAEFRALEPLLAGGGAARPRQPSSAAGTACAARAANTSATASERTAARVRLSGREGRGALPPPSSFALEERRGFFRLAAPPSATPSADSSSWSSGAASTVGGTSVAVAVRSGDCASCLQCGSKGAAAAEAASTSAMASARMAFIRRSLSS